MNKKLLGLVMVGVLSVTSLPAITASAAEVNTTAVSTTSVNYAAKSAKHYVGRAILSPGTQGYKDYPSGAPDVTFPTGAIAYIYTDNNADGESQYLARVPGYSGYYYIDADMINEWV